MRKAYIGLATAAAILLAGCGGNNNNNYNSKIVPEVQDTLTVTSASSNIENRVGYIEGCANIGDLGNKEMFEQHVYGVDVVVFQKFPDGRKHVAGTYRKTELEKQIGLSFEKIFSDSASNKIKSKYVGLDCFNGRTESLLYKFAFDKI